MTPQKFKEPTEKVDISQLLKVTPARVSNQLGQKQEEMAKMVVTIGTGIIEKAKNIPGVKESDLYKLFGSGKQEMV